MFFFLFRLVEFRLFSDCFFLRTLRSFSISQVLCSLNGNQFITRRTRIDNNHYGFRSTVDCVLCALCCCCSFPPLHSFIHVLLFVAGFFPVLLFFLCWYCWWSAFCVRICELARSICIIIIDACLFCFFFFFLFYLWSIRFQMFPAIHAGIEVSLAHRKFFLIYVHNVVALKRFNSFLRSISYAPFSSCLCFSPRNYLMIQLWLCWHPFARRNKIDNLSLLAYSGLYNDAGKSTKFNLNSSIVAWISFGFTF